MFRLTVLLGLGLYGAMLTLGQDNGQLRFGLMQAKAGQEAQMLAAQTPAPEPAPADPAPMVVAAAFVPETPLMTAPEPAADPVADTAKGKLFYVASDSANVRQGPGKEHAVLERLPKGEAVLVLEQGTGPDGWSLIRIEGDGVEGYIAARLLTE